MASKSPFLDATLLRRSYIDIKKESTISDARIEDIVKHAILHCPTAFSVQSTRAVVLLHNDHDKLWDMIHEHAQKSFPPDLFAERITPNLKATKGSYGTVLFFDDPEAVEAMPPRIGHLLKSFPEWGEQANGMAQYVVWTAFAAEGLGANVQHYQKGGLTPKINAEWGLPASWDLKAQMAFGTPAGPPRGGFEKQFAPIEPRVRVFGK